METKSLWQVQMLDDDATASRGYQVYKVLAELDWYHADYERQELQKSGHLARIVEVNVKTGWTF